MSSPSVGHRSGEPAFRRALLALFAIGIGTFAMIYSVQPLLAVAATDLDVSAASGTMLMTVTTFALAVAVLPLARLSEWCGRKPIIIGGLAVSVVTGIASAIAPSFALILVLRAVQGAALAGVPAAALAWVAEEIHPSAITRVGGLYIAGNTLGGMGGRVLAGFASELVGWRGAIIVVCILGAVVGLAAHLLLPTAQASPARSSGAALAARPDSAEARRSRLVLYGLAFLGMATFVGIYNVLSFRTSLPPYSLGAGLGSMFYLSYIAGTFTSTFAGRLADRTGIRAGVLLGLAVCVGGVLITLATSMVLIWAGLFLLAGGFFVVHSLASANAARLSPRPSDGSGRYTLFYYLGSSVGGVLLGLAWDLGQWGATAAGAVVLLVLATVLALWLPRRPPAGAPPGGAAPAGAPPGTPPSAAPGAPPPGTAPPASA
ncbi:MFS transporter [Georgenia sp. Z1491]|uniref:MFS transporter n=1 Tax=Georgenia sp. Z1491 TaxID=3416707 RepID=UPI003CEADB29